jgi:hypothetical protein
VLCGASNVILLLFTTPCCQRCCCVKGQLTCKRFQTSGRQELNLQGAGAHPTKGVHPGLDRPSLLGTSRPQPARTVRGWPQGGNCWCHGRTHQQVPHPTMHR